MKQIIIRPNFAVVEPLLESFVRAIGAKAELTYELLESDDEHDTSRCGVVAVFRRRGGKLEVLMAKREYDPQAGKWALPGGHCKKGESNEDGARREVAEEVGVEVDALTFYEKKESDEETGDVAIIFGTLYTGDDKAEAMDDETRGVKWFDVASLPDGLAFDNNDLIPKIAAKMSLTESDDLLGFLDADAPSAQGETEQWLIDTGWRGRRSPRRKGVVSYNRRLGNAHIGLTRVLSSIGGDVDPVWSVDVLEWNPNPPHNNLHLGVLQSQLRELLERFFARMKGVGRGELPIEAMRHAAEELGIHVDI